MNQPLRIPSAASLIADALLDGESVDMGAYSITFQDAVLSDSEQAGDLSRALLLWRAGQITDDQLHDAMDTTAEAYAEEKEADWVGTRDHQRNDEAIRERDEERLIRECH